MAKTDVAEVIEALNGIKGRLSEIGMGNAVSPEGHGAIEYHGMKLREDLESLESAISNGTDQLERIADALERLADHIAPK